MLRVLIHRVHPDKLEDLTAWMAELDGPRRDEALATLVDEGCRHETAMLIPGADGPVIVYAWEVEDEDAARAAAAKSTHPVGMVHKRVMGTVLGDRVEAQLLLDLRP